VPERRVLSKERKSMASSLPYWGGMVPESAFSSMYIKSSRLIL